MRPLLDGPLQAVAVGAPLFAESLAAQGAAVQTVDWRPPADGSEHLSRLLARSWDARVDEANQVALRRVLEARQVLGDVRPAGEVVPGLERDMVLHAGPPIEWEQMSAPIRAAGIGATIHEGLAPDAESAERLLAGGGVRFEPCHDHQTVGPMAGMTTYSMPVLIVENRASGNRAYSILNEGLGRGLRYGGLRPYVLQRLGCMRRVLRPALRPARPPPPHGVRPPALLR